MKDLMVRETYTKDGVEKNSWNKIGILIDGKEGKQYIKLFHMPNILISIFEQKPKEVPTTTGSQAQAVTDIKWEE